MTDVMTSTAETPANARPTPARRFPYEYLFSLAIVVVLTALLEYAARAGWITPLVFPAPSLIGAALVDGISSGLYVEHAASTVYSVLMGFFVGAVIAIALAGILSSTPMLERTLTPFFVAFQSMPKIAIAPLIIIWFGFGELSKTIIVVAVCFFPILINSLHGLKVRERDHYELLKSLGANKWQMFFRLRLPHAMPYVFAGLHLGIIFALIGTVVAEFVGSNAGIGYLMLQAKASFDSPAVYACLVILTAIGVVLHAIMVQLEARVVFWGHDVSRVNV
jgi:NitT/TauT family transport system permease protein